MRLAERTSLNKDDVDYYFNNSLKIGNDNSRRAHYLFYNTKDGDFFVIVYDKKYDEAITILREDMYRCTISDETKQYVYNIFRKVSVGIDNIPPSVVKVKYFNRVTRKYKKGKSIKDDGMMEAILNENDINFNAMVKKYIKDIVSNIKEKFDNKEIYVYFSVGKNSKIYLYDFEQFFE